MMIMCLFQSTQPKRAATLIRRARSGRTGFQSTQPKRAATAQEIGQQIIPKISIHAAQEGCDSELQDALPNGKFISIHAAQEGCDITSPLIKGKGGTISIHAAQEGCDFTPPTAVCSKKPFQSTQPKRAATSPMDDFGSADFISIHAAQEGCDSIRINCNYYSFYSYKSAKLTFLLN